MLRGRGALMGGKLAVLMYHALTDAEGRCADADPHYAIQPAQFASHIDTLKEAGLQARSVKSIQTGTSPAKIVAMTFDDGHASNAKAAEMLAACSFSADFFVNPSTVGQPNYLSWSELRNMVSAGMSVQSHGYHHRYLNELTREEVMAELVDSKREIEDRLGEAVTVFAPPGGRTSDGLAQSAASVGYSALCTSKVGLWQWQDGPWCIPRFAVLHTTSEARFERWITKDWREMAMQHTRHAVLSSAKRLLGNRGYERLRGGLLRSGQS